MGKNGWLLGLDIGTSSIKASAIDSESGEVTGSATSPEQELNMISAKPGWAEQHPQTWWKHVVQAVRELVSGRQIPPERITAIGISYQMHGLVAVDKDHQVLRPSIIWCDSRAVEIGRKAFDELGQRFCLDHFLNSPGNFTASKLKWVQLHEPELYRNIHKIMLPGDYIAMKMTGRINTTVSGLSEGIFWDYRNEAPARKLLEHFGISEKLLPEACNSFEVHGELTAKAAAELGLTAGIKISYRAGDQPNNAFSLNVLNPGEAAATAGTSGVVYGVADRPVCDSKSRVNTFVHVNHLPDRRRYGVLMCLNGTGILNSWLKKILGTGRPVTYEEMNRLAARMPVGAGGLTFLPFGNGAERILENQNPGALVCGLDFNRHDASHLLRAAQEGIVFALHYGLNILKDLALPVETIKAGRSNMFLSPLFREAFVNTTGARLELYDTDGAHGAARGAGIGAGVYSGPEEAFESLEQLEVIEPDSGTAGDYKQAYQLWLDRLRAEGMKDRKSNKNQSKL